MAPVRQTSCRYCGQDIEGWNPYRRGEWHDRGGNTHCPTPEGDRGLEHAPYREGVSSEIPKRYRTEEE